MPLSRIKPALYRQELSNKIECLRDQFNSVAPPELEVFESAPVGFRMRAEFRVWHDADDLNYVMFRPGEPKDPVPIADFPIACERIQLAMDELIDRLRPNPTLRRKLFQVEFLATLSDELLITLIYHRPLDSDWEVAAKSLCQPLTASIVGRSRKQKLVIGQDFVTESLPLDCGEYQYRQYEQSFTQPNATVNVSMINWADSVAAGITHTEGSPVNSAATAPSSSRGDLLELYCGNGNFTLPLARHFDAVIATEVSKRSVQAALHNADLNQIPNVSLIRLAAEEVCVALDREREFRRLQQLPKPLDEYEFSTVFVDPPRAGLDAATEALVSRFDHILYISCNPKTLLNNVRNLSKTHRVMRMAAFDQFPYTDHIECGVLLTRHPDAT